MKKDTIKEVTRPFTELITENKTKIAIGLTFVATTAMWVSLGDRAFKTYEQFLDEKGLLDEFHNWTPKE